MKKISILLTVIFMVHVFISHASGSPAEKKDPITVPQLFAGMADYEKKDITLVGTIAGACMSGCKMWLSDGKYENGDPVVLVWAKDKAFTFKTDAAGQRVKLQGFAVGKYVDLCAIEKQGQKDQNKAADASGKDKKDCDPLLKERVETEKEVSKQLKSVTFFATSVDYLNN